MAVHLRKSSPRKACQASLDGLRWSWSLLLTRCLGKVRKRFGNLEDPQILCALGIGLISQVDAWDDPCWPTRDQEPGATAMRLAAMTSIPRQTVRRRLQAMEQLGWVYQSNDHRWHLALKADGSPRVQLDFLEIDPDLLLPNGRSAPCGIARGGR